jgi:hypothetical protein
MEYYDVLHGLKRVRWDYRSLADCVAMSGLPDATYGNKSSKDTQKQSPLLIDETEYQNETEYQIVAQIKISSDASYGDKPPMTISYRDFEGGYCPRCCRCCRRC